MALSKEQAKAFYDKAIEAGYSDDEIVAELKKRNSQPSARKQAFSNDNPLGMAANALQQSAPGQFFTGMGEQLGEGVRGARQLFNVLTGDEEELAQLKRDETRIQQESEALRNPDQLSTLLRGAGRGAGALLPAALTGGAGAPAALGLAGRAGLGAVGGALGGAAQPLQEGQDESQRLRGAIIGGAAGGVTPLALAGLSKGAQLMSRMEPDEALQKFTAEQLKAVRGGENLPAYRRVGEKVAGEEDRLRKLFSERYSGIEDQDLPPVMLSGTARTTGEIPTGMTDEVAMAFSPRARKIVQAANRGATHSSPIVDPTTGKNIQFPESTSFGDVRQAIRELRQVRRVLARNDATAGQSAQLGRVQDALQEDLETWAAKDPKLADVLRQGKQVDIDYKEQVVPFSSQQTQLGKYGKTNQYDEKTLDRLFMDNQQGQALKDLVGRVPGVEDDLRQIYGSKLLESRGKVGTIRQMEGGTAGEVLLKPEERKYLTKVADALREDTPNGNMVIDLVRDLKRLPGIRRAIKVATGVDPYEAAQRGMFSKNALADMLRGAIIGQSVGDE